MIYKLDKEKKAEWIIKRLPNIWIKLNWLQEQLLYFSRNFNTIELIIERDNHKSTYQYINDYYTNNKTFFDTNYPLYKDAIQGAITGLTNINNIINNGLKNHYWDNITNTPIVMNITQQDRTLLSNQIKTELE